MGLWDKIKGEFIDIIEWVDSTNDTMVYRFDRHNNEIKYGAKLTVRESQIAVFVNEGKFADVFMPGMYTLETQNVPILSTLQGWKYGFSSPFKAEIYFVSTKNFTDQKWGTKNPITLHDDRFGMVEIRAFGTFATRIIEPKTFLQEVVGTDDSFTMDGISNQLKSLIVTRFSDLAGESQIPIEKYAGQLNELSGVCLEKLDNEFVKYGLSVTQFLIENVSMPEEIKKEIFELSRLDRIDIQKLQQMKAAKAIEVAAANPGGLAAAGVGIGMGYSMAQQTAQAMNPGNFQATSNPPENVSAVPPPIPQPLSFYVAQAGQQSGPYDINVLSQMLAQGSFTRESLVWKAGMPQWTIASQVSELAALFATTPPPLPR